TPGTHDEEAGSSRSKRLRQQEIVEEFIPKLARKCKVLTEDVVRSLSAPIYCRDLDATTLRDLINSDGKLIPEDPQPSVPRVGIPRPPRASMLDLYDMMGRMEIRQDAIERMELGSHVTRTCIMECLSIWQGFIVFYCSEPTTRPAMLSRSITSTITSISLHHHSISSRSRMMTSSVEMARVGFVTAYDEISNLVDLHIGMFGGGWKWKDIQGLL
nr:hypothetical protein [Tanacetum cinerariifolium]